MVGEGHRPLKPSNRNCSHFYREDINLSEGIEKHFPVETVYLTTSFEKTYFVYFILLCLMKDKLQ